MESVDRCSYAGVESLKLLGLPKERFLIHHGVKGQKWGVRNGPPYPIKEHYVPEEGIKDPDTGENLYLIDGTRIRNPKVFAGNGTTTPLAEEVAEGLAEQLGSSPEKWQHAKGTGQVDYYGEAREAEIHWFQEESVGKHKYKVKKWLDD